MYCLCCGGSESQHYSNEIDLSIISAPGTARPVGDALNVSGDFKTDILIQGSKWSSPDMSFAIWDNVFDLYDDPFMQLLGDLTGPWETAEVTMIRQALSTYETFTNLRFTDVSNQGQITRNSDLEFSKTGFVQQATLGSIGLGVFPDPEFGDAWLGMLGLSRNEFPNVEGSIYLDTSHDAFSHMQEGGRGFWVTLHEIGHALGLKHTHDDGGNGRPSLKDLNLEQYDNHLYTMMSYHAVEGSELNHNNIVTPMVFDMLALQEMYGTNWAYNAGNTTYNLADDGIIETIWDGGGTDMFDASTTTSHVKIDLRQGQISEIGDTYQAIAYKVQIEQAKGGTVGDIIQGNAANNTLYGMLGNDTLRGATGNDTIYGGRGLADGSDGADVIYGDAGHDWIVSNSGDDTIYGGVGIADANSGNDTIYAGYGSDDLYGNSGNDSLFGGGGIAAPNDLHDELYGGSGNDGLYGNGGNDTLYGGTGNDILHGGIGDDMYVMNDAGGNDTILHFTGAGQSGGDVLVVEYDINGSGITTAQHVLDRATVQGDHLNIDLGSGNSVLIQYGLELAINDIVIA